jgi:hypothetical protein
VALQTVTDAVNYHTFIAKILIELLIKNLSSAEFVGSVSYFIHTFLCVWKLKSCEDCMFPLYKLSEASKNLMGHSSS